MRKPLRLLKKYLRQAITRLSYIIQNSFTYGGESLASQRQVGAFKELYSGAIRSRLSRSQHSASLGANLRGVAYEESGRGFFKSLKDYGLKEDDVCVDYGCGTLRVGMHVIRYLRRGAYWGMDIDHFLLDEGRKLIGEALCAEKEPNLRVISPKTIAEAAASQPAMLLSVKVLSHVPPGDLAEYFENIMTIIGPSGQAIIRSRWSNAETVQCNKWIWAHSMPGIAELVSRLGGETIVLHQKGRGPMSGVFQILPRATRFQQMETAVP